MVSGIIMCIISFFSLLSIYTSGLLISSPACYGSRFLRNNNSESDYSCIYTSPLSALVEVFCGEEPTTDHGSCTDCNSTNFRPNSTRTYVCEEGFKHRSTVNTIRCLNSGHWTAPLVCAGNDTTQAFQAVLVLIFKSAILRSSSLYMI